MKSVIVLSLLVTAFAWGQQGVLNAGTADEITYTTVEIEPTREMLDRIQFYETCMSDESLGEVTVILDQIINLGQKVWAVLEKNQPVQNVHFNYANALPQGAQAGDLENFSELQHKSFRTYGTNGFGMQVYDLRYSLVHRHGGQYRGKGKFLTDVTVLPQTVETSWGYTTNLNVDRVSVSNLGTRENPVGALTMQLKFSVSTIMKKGEYNEVYDFRGNSAEVTAVR
jgi:hypothetical protein